MRMVFMGPHPVFPMPDVAAPQMTAMVFYVLLGAVMGVAAALITRLVYFTEDAFEKLPIHWMWWPLIGGLAVGICGYFVPRTLGVGYENISAILSSDWTLKTVAILCVVKLISWTIAISSGTSGGTMAPLFTIGGAMGQVLGGIAAAIVPAAAIDLKVAGLVGMAAMFAGASRAFLACTVFAFEATLQPFSLLPLLGGCAASYLAATLVMKNSLMTEKIVRRGVATTHEYTADLLAQITVREVAGHPVVTLSATQTVGEIRHWFESGKPESNHQGFPILDEANNLVGVLTRRDLLDPEIHGNKLLKDLPGRLPKFVYEDCTVRQAVDHMVRHEIGLLPVMTHDKPPKLVGIVTRKDILSAFKRGLDESTAEAPTIKIPGLRRNSRRSHSA
jgi:CBS domain-containing protein